MRASKMVLVGVASVGAVLVSAPAQSAVTVLGSGFARTCYEYAESGRASDRGVENCDRALREEGLTVRDRAATFVNRGILHMQARQLDRALADYDAAIGIRPELAEAYVNRGIALVHLGGRDSEAVDALSRGLSLNTMRPEIAYFSRGIANELLGRTRAAYNDYRQAASLKPEWKEPQLQLQRFTVVRKDS